MNRLNERIAKCQGMCTHNGQMMPELYGLLDAQSGNHYMLLRIGAREVNAYNRGYTDGLTLKLLDAQEADSGFHQPGITPSVCVAEVK